MGTWRVLSVSHAAFGDAARDAIRAARFHPAEVGGIKVRQLARLPFTFTPTR